MKFMKKDGRDIKGGKCMRGKDRRLDSSEKNQEKNMENSHGGDHE